MIPVHSPLVFDFFDTWSGRALGGCTYRVVHPGGRNYEHFPVNALEAEARRVGRFEALGHAHGALVAPPLFSRELSSDISGPSEPRFANSMPNMPSAGRFYRHSADKIGAPPPPRPNLNYPYTLDLRFDT
jgi:hypothetical protein